MSRTRAIDPALPLKCSGVERRVQGTKSPSRCSAGTMLRDIIDQAEGRTIAFDEGARELFGPYTDSAPMRAVDLTSKLGDQPELRTIAGALLMAGIAMGSDRLVRAGARM